MRRTQEQKVVTLALWPSASLAAQLNVVWVRMAERSKALRSGRSPLLWAWVRIPLLTITFYRYDSVAFNIDDLTNSL